MPISHLLSESFYVVQEQQGHSDKDEETLIVSLENDSHLASNNGNFSRHVRFLDNVDQRTRNNLYPVVAHSTNINNDPKIERAQFEDEIKIPLAYSASGNNNNGYYNPCHHHENLRNKHSQQLQLSSERKVTNKVAWNGYAYTKRGEQGGVSYWYCDQRKTCSASLIEKSGVFTRKAESSEQRRTRRGWTHDGQHESHPPDPERINKEIATRTKRLEKRKRAQLKRANVTSFESHHTVETAQVISDSINASTNSQLKQENAELRIKSVWSFDLDHDDDHDTSVIPVLIDTDGGVFDAWALGLALKSSTFYRTDKRFKIVGITTVNGCTTVENAVKNVGRVFHATGENAENTFIFKGMDSPLVGSKDNFTRPAFYGSDGFGDALQSTPLEEEPKVIPEHGVTAIIKLAQKYSGRLTILALGPLTNLAMAVKLQPKIRNQVKEIFIVGGNSEGIGNVTVCSEFNFHVDPEAAHVVLENFNPCPVYLLPWETCMRSAASSYGFRTNTIGTLNTPFISLLNKVEAKHLSKHRDIWVAPDAVLVACFMDKKIMSKTENYYCSVELQGKFTRGMTIVDKNFLNQKPGNVMLITEIDRQMYEAMLIEVLASQNHMSHNASYDPQGHSLPLQVEHHYF